VQAILSELRENFISLSRSQISDPAKDESERPDAPALHSEKRFSRGATERAESFVETTERPSPLLPSSPSFRSKFSFQAEPDLSVGSGSRFEVLEKALLQDAIKMDLRESQGPGVSSKRNTALQIPLLETMESRQR
jgi:hypothetical protein